MLLMIIVWPNGRADAFLSRNLSLGDRGAEVRELQIFLNRSGLLVATAGPGAPGKETEFFGPLTKQAVIRYQERYRDQVLTPIGLTYGTGYVGPLTRARLKSDQRELIDKLVSGSQTTTTEPSTAINLSSIVVTAPLDSELNDNDTTGQSSMTQPADQQALLPSTLTGLVDDVSGFVWPEAPQESTTMSLTSLDPSSGPGGTKVTITGRGFDGLHIVYTGNEVIENVRSDDGRTLEITIKDNFSDGNSGDSSLTLPLHIYVENESGISNDLVFNLSFD